MSETKCKGESCKHFEIIREPYRSAGVCYEEGLAKCNKSGMVLDFYSHKKFTKVECVGIGSDKE